MLIETFAVKRSRKIKLKYESVAWKMTERLEYRLKGLNCVLCGLHLRLQTHRDHELIADMAELLPIIIIAYTITGVSGGNLWKTVKCFTLP